MELEDFVGDLVPLSFDQDISPVVLDMVRLYCMVWVSGIISMAVVSLS